MPVTKSATEPMARWGTAYGRWGTAAMAREQIRVCDRKRLFGNRWLMSVLPAKAAVKRTSKIGSFVPIADIRPALSARRYQRWALAT